MNLHFVAVSVACGMYGLVGNQYDPLKVGAVLGALQAALLVKEKGLDKIVDVLMANKVFFFVMFLPTAYMAFF